MIPSALSHFKSIPLFDLNQFNSHHSDQREEFIRRLREVCHHVGFFYIKNHGIELNLMNRMLQLTEIFFNLPQEEKDQVNINLSTHFRGYGKLKSETTLGIPDYKESFDLGLEQPTRSATEEHPYFILQGPNQWPLSSALLALNWKETMLEYLVKMQRLGKHLMNAMSLVLGFPADFFAQQFCFESPDAYALLRLLRYPPGKELGSQQEPVLGVGPHIDAGCLVILLQDETGGLQVQNANGQWVDAPPVPGTYVVNIGETLATWSNNYFLATPHRVINRSAHTRHSVPFFLEPHLTTVVSPLTLPDVILKTMTREQAPQTKKINYGKQILNVYQRSFQSVATV